MRDSVWAVRVLGILGGCGTETSSSDTAESLCARTMDECGLEASRVDACVAGYELRIRYSYEAGCAAETDAFYECVLAAPEVCSEAHGACEHLTGALQSCWQRNDGELPCIDHCQRCEAPGSCFASCDGRGQDWQLVGCLAELDDLSACRAEAECGNEAACESPAAALESCRAEWCSGHPGYVSPRRHVDCSSP